MAHFEAGPVRELIHQLKYDRTLELADILGGMLSSILAGKSLNDYWLVPVPLHASRLNERGFNQAELLARSVAKTTGLQVVNCIKRIRPTVSQTGLERSQRLTNVDGAFALTMPVLGQRIILVDDVITTGATMEECAGVLKRAGAERVWGLAVARG